MQYIKIQNGVPAEWPVYEQGLRNAVSASLPVQLTNAILAPFGFAILVIDAQPTFNDRLQKLVENAPAPQSNGDWRITWTVANKYDDPAEQAAAQQAEVARVRAEKWEQIKALRDAKTQRGGYKVGSDWFHSDTFSRTQQIGLTIMGANVPAGLMWKTMGGTFVPMTPTLAQQIFAAAGAQDAALFAHAEALKAQMEASADPAGFDITAGWPATYGGV